jgi:hypothetical protein
VLNSSQILVNFRFWIDNWEWNEGRFVTFLTILSFDKIHALFAEQLSKSFDVESPPESTLQFAQVTNNPLNWPVKDFRNSMNLNHPTVSSSFFWEMKVFFGRRIWVHFNGAP